MNQIRTDLAIELNEIAKNGKTGDLDGIKTKEEVWDGIGVTRVDITNEAGAKKIKKAQGIYITLHMHDLMGREEDSFSRTVRAVAKAIQIVIDDKKENGILVAGLGNRAITPDAIGPQTTENVLVTRHLVEKTPQYFGEFRKVSAIAPGVLAMTGIESSEIIRGVIEKANIKYIIAVDAIVARRISRLLKTIQISNTGIVPGGGVGNQRMAITEEELGIPVIAIGVPTVVDGQTLAQDIREQTGAENCEALDDLNKPILVTTKDIDTQINNMARVIGYGINLALHPGISIEDIDLFLS